jgi:hypothetical protein
LAAAYFGSGFEINDYLKIRQPLIKEIIEYGEREYWQLVNCMTILSCDMKSELADAGKYWGDVPDFEMFYLMARTLPPEKTRILFGDGLDFRNFGWYKNPETDMFCMIDPVNGYQIDELLHAKIFNYICAIHGIVKRPEFAGNEITREFMVEEDRMNKRRMRSKAYTSTLFPLASYLSSTSKCAPAELGQMKIFAFLDTIKRTSAVNTTNLLLNGIYAGKVDGDKVSKKALDPMRDIYAK